MLFRGPDSELAAAVQKSHQVPHAVVIAVTPGWDLGIPQGLDELRRARIRRRQTGHSVRGDQGGRMGIAHLVAIQRELVSIGVYALGVEERLDPVAESSLPDRKSTRLNSSHAN